MRKLGKKMHEVIETIEAYDCYMLCGCSTCSCNCNPTTCGGYTSAIATTGSSNIGATSYGSVEVRNKAIAYN